MRAHPLLFGLVALASFGCDGPYVVLDGLATNCSVEGPDSARVAITPGQVADAAFEVACRAVTGAIEVAVPTAGRDLDPDGYAVLVNGARRPGCTPAARSSSRACRREATW